MLGYWSFILQLYKVVWFFLGVSDAQLIFVEKVTLFKALCDERFGLGILEDLAAIDPQMELLSYSLLAIQAAELRFLNWGIQRAVVELWAPIGRGQFCKAISEILAYMLMFVSATF